MEQLPSSVTDDSLTSGDEYHAELTHSRQSNIPPPPPPQSISPTLKHESTNTSTTLTFPTLNLDGSIDELSTAACPPPETPPAALSSLGRKVRMPNSNMLDSISSLDDQEQYEFVPDEYDFSADDRAETASLATTERGDGSMTPEDSIVDLEEEDRNDMADSITLQDTLETLPRQPRSRSDSQTRAENELLDSYMTDDLETPRQSGRLFGPGSPHDTINDPRLSPPRQARTTKPISVLFVSERSVSDGEVARACRQLASCLSSTENGTGGANFAKLPPPPGTSERLSRLLVVVDDVELIVQHCVHAHNAIQDQSNVYPFYIRSDGGEYLEAWPKHTGTPDLILYYLLAGHGYPTWFASVARAMGETNAASMMLGGPGFKFSELSLSQKITSRSDIAFDSEQFYGEDELLRNDLQVLLKRKPKKDMQTKRQTLGAGENRPKHKSLLTGLNPSTGAIRILSFAFALIFLGYMGINTFTTTSNPAVDLAVRRAALANALIEATNSTDAAQTFNVTHLIPRSPASTHELFYEGRAPNSIVVSLPKKRKGRGFSSVTEWRVSRTGAPEISHNVTKLIDGVYHISIIPQEAYSQVCTNFLLKDPSANTTFCHDFGSRFLQRNTYEKASKELSKIVNKDVAIASQRVKSIKQKLGLELAAGASATRNVTTQLAVYVARDLQVFAHTAVSVFGKISEEGQDAVKHLKVKMRGDAHKVKTVTKHGLQNLQDAAQKSLQTTSQFTKDLIPTRKTVGKSLSGARERALSIKNRLQGLKKDINTNSTSATKELSLRLQHFFKPSEKGKRAGSLKDIAKCVRADDYRACRRQQRMDEKDKNKVDEVVKGAVKEWMVQKAVATVPEKKALQQDDPPKHIQQVPGGSHTRTAAKSIRTGTKAKKCGRKGGKKGR